MGTSLNVSTPPVMIVEALPNRIFSAALVMATLEEMHACYMCCAKVEVGNVC